MTFNPDWETKISEHLQEWLDANGVWPQGFAIDAGIPQGDVYALLDGKLDGKLTPEMAKALERGTRGYLKAYVWLRLDKGRE